MNFTKKVKNFISCIKKSSSANEAILLAHKKHKLNAADNSGGLGSDASAWQEANNKTNWPFAGGV